MNSSGGWSQGVVELTPAGGGLGVVGISGPEAASLLERCFRSYRRQPGDQAVGSIEAGCWLHQAATADRVGKPHREVVVVVRTAEDRWEVHSHGGRAVSDSIISSLSGASSGPAKTTAAGNAVPGGTVSTASLEQRLATAGGRRAAQIIARQLAGGFAAELARVDQLLVEAAANRSRSCSAAAAAVQRLLRASRVGLRLPQPWRVVVRGAVNVGKSSLINSLAGFDRSLVSPAAGTTRDLLPTRLVLDGWEVELIDTAGLRAAGDQPAARVERAGIERGEAAAASADLILDLFPAAELGEVPASSSDRPRLVVGTKADLLTATAAAVFPQQPGLVLTSAKTGLGISRLIEALIARLVPEAADGLLDRGVPVTPEQLDQVRRRQQRLATLAAG